LQSLQALQLAAGENLDLLAIHGSIIQSRALAVSFYFLLLLLTVGNLAIGFGLGVHFGFGPDFSRLAAQWRELRLLRRSKKGP
jgi:hypothetical protein